MNDDVRRRREMFQRVNQFLTDNPPTVGSEAAAQATIVSTIVGDTDVSTSTQVEGTLDQGSAVDVKAVRRERLRDMIYSIARTARSMEYKYPGTSGKYQVPANLNDAALIATSHAFYTNTAADETYFIAFEMDSGFRDTLHDWLADFESSAAEIGAATDKHVAATATARSQVRQGMVAVRTLDGIMKNKYAANPGLLAAWISASHVEAAPKKPTPPPPVPPTP